MHAFVLYRLRAPPDADGAHLQAASERVPSVRAEITLGFSAALQKAFPSVDIQPAVAATNNPDHGDYQCNNAMALFGRMKGKVSEAHSNISLLPS